MRSFTILRVSGSGLESPSLRVTAIACVRDQIVGYGIGQTKGIRLLKLGCAFWQKERKDSQV